MMGLKENLKAGKEAIKYVKSTGVKACNKISDRIEASGGIENVIGTNQGANAPGIAGNQLGIVRNTQLTDFRAKVALYIAQGAGNCQEQAEMALLYIYDNFNSVLPLDLMAFSNDEYDHVWVGIGLQPEWSKIDPWGNHNLNAWGPNAVWCDPWQGDEGMCFAIDDLIKGKVRNLNAIYKCNTAKLVEAGKPESLFRVNA